MQSIINHLFEGKISVYEHLHPYNYEEARHQVVKSEEALMKDLSESSKQKLEEFGDKKDIATNLLIQQSFVDGFKLGAKLVLEIYEKQ